MCTCVSTMISAFKRIHSGRNTTELVRSITEHGEAKTRQQGCFHGISKWTRTIFIISAILKFISVRVIFSTWNITRSESEILCVLFKHEFSQFLQASSIDVGGGGLGPLRFFFAANLQYKKWIIIELVPILFGSM